MWIQFFEKEDVEGIRRVIMVDGKTGGVVIISCTTIRDLETEQNLSIMIQ